MNRILIVGGLLLALGACGQQAGETDEHGHTGEHAEEGGENGPHGGRLLRTDDFAVEIAIVESGAEPEFHVYAYDDKTPVAPSKLRLSVTTKRLGGKSDAYAFAPHEDALVSTSAVEEPHSFDVAVSAAYNGKSYQWTYESYEGRVKIAAAIAKQQGVVVESVGPATVKETVELLGHVELAPGAKADLRARFAGRVLSVSKNVGDPVRAGDELARVESNESLQSYAITSPINGVVLERNVNQGDVTGDGVLFSVGDPGRVTADFHVFERDSDRVKAGQAIRIAALHGSSAIETKIASLSPVKDPTTQTRTARAIFANDGAAFLPGTPVKGDVVVNEVQVPVAVKTSAIQRFREGEAVFVRVGDAYEARPIEVGRRTTEWTEVLNGVEPGQEYVVTNSFLVKAEIEKSGASHEH